MIIIKKAFVTTTMIKAKRHSYVGTTMIVIKITLCHYNNDSN